MTDPDEDAAATPRSASGSGTEPTAAGYEAPPIEQVRAQPTQPQIPPGQDYISPPAYGIGGAPPPPDATLGAPGYPLPAYGVPDYPATGYPPPPPGFGAPQDPWTGYPPPPGFGPPPYGAPPPYGFPPAPGYPYPPAQTVPQNNLAIASLVCSGLSVPMFFLCFILGPPSAIAGIVLGIVALNQTKKTGQRGRELAIAGIVLGSLVLVAGIALGVLIVSIASVSP